MLYWLNWLYALLFTADLVVVFVVLGALLLWDLNFFILILVVLGLSWRIVPLGTWANSINIVIVVIQAIVTRVIFFIFVIFMILCSSILILHHSPLILSQSCLLCCILQDHSVHHLHLTSSCSLSIDHPVNWNITTVGIETKWSYSMRVNVHVFVILSIPAFVVQVEQVSSLSAFYYDFYCCLAPNVFCITHV